MSALRSIVAVRMLHQPAECGCFTVFRLLLQTHRLRLQLTEISFPGLVFFALIYSHNTHNNNRKQCGHINTNTKNDVYA